MTVNVVSGARPDGSDDQKEGAGISGGQERAGGTTGTRRRPTHTRSPWRWVIAFCSYALVAAFAFLPVWVHWSTQMNGCNCWDQIMQEWYFAWFPAAVAHGHSLLVTNYLDGPGGVNLMWNTSFPLLSILGAPLVALFGVVHAFTMVLALGMALSATTMYLLLRTWVGWAPAAWSGGLLYGFSSLVVVEAAQGRLNLAFLPLPPLIVMVVVRIVRQPESTMARNGVLLGVLVAAQLYISEEILLITAILIAVGLVAAAVIRPQGLRLRERAGAVLRAGGPAAGVVAVLCGYPVYVQFFGADRLTGPVQSHAQLAVFSADLTSPLIPSTAQALTVGWTNRLSAAFSSGSAGEITEYIGVVLLVVLVVSAVVLRRTFLVQLSTIIWVVSFSLALGPRVIVDSHRTSIPGPGAVVAHLPVAGNIIPARWALGMWFAGAIILASAMVHVREHLRSRLPERVAPGHARSGRHRRDTPAHWHKWLPAASALALAVACVVPLVPRWPYSETPADVPPFFTSGDVTRIPAGAQAVTYPYALTAMAWPMLWQAESGMRFRLLGGYVIGPAPTGAGTYFADPNPVEYCLLTIYTKDSAPATLCSPSYLKASLKSLKVSQVLVGRTQQHAALARSVLTAALGAPPHAVGGVLQWWCVPTKDGAGCRWE